MSMALIVTPVQLRVAPLAEPDQRLPVRGAALDLDHEPPGVGGAMGRVERVGGDEEQLTLADDGVLAGGPPRRCTRASWRRGACRRSRPTGRRGSRAARFGPRMTMAVNCESSQITLLPTGGSKLARFSSIHRHRSALMRGRMGCRSLRLGRAQHNSNAGRCRTMPRSEPRRCRTFAFPETRRRFASVRGTCASARCCRFCARGGSTGRSRARRCGRCSS